MEWQKISLAEYQNFQGFYEEEVLGDDMEGISLKPEPMPRPTAPTNPEGGGVRNLADDMNAIATADYNERLMEYKQSLLDNRMARLNSNNGSGSDKRVEALEKQLADMKLQSIQNEFSGKLAELGNKFEKMTDVLSRPSDPLSPLQSMIQGWQLMKGSPFGGNGTDASIEQIKNQGTYMQEMMKMFQMELGAFNSGVSRIGDAIETGMEAKRRQEILDRTNGNVPRLPTREERQLGGERGTMPPIATAQELEEVANRSVGDNPHSAYLERIMHEVAEQEIPEGAYWCGKCSVDEGKPKHHLKGSYVHGQHFAERLV